MATIKDRINSSKGNQKKVLEAVFEDIMNIACEYANYAGNPLTPESGELSNEKVKLLGRILGLETEEDWAQVREAYLAGKEKSKANML